VCGRLFVYLAVFVCFSVCVSGCLFLLLSGADDGQEAKGTTDATQLKAATDKSTKTGILL
jgi:hypothetical protein